MAAYEDATLDFEEKRRQQYADASKRLKEETAAGKREYNKELLDTTAKTGGVYVPPPTAMPLPPDMTRAQDRRDQARRRRRGRQSTILSESALGAGGETLG